MFAVPHGTERKLTKSQFGLRCSTCLSSRDEINMYRPRSILLTTCENFVGVNICRPYECQQFFSPKLANFWFSFLFGIAHLLYLFPLSYHVAVLSISVSGEETEMLNKNLSPPSFVSSSPKDEFTTSTDSLYNSFLTYTYDAIIFCNFLIARCL